MPLPALRPHLDAMGIAYHPEPDLGWDAAAAAADVD